MYSNFLTIENDEIKLEAVLWFNQDKNKSNSRMSIYYNIIRKIDNVVIGNCGIRLANNEENHYLGNIEYEIFEQYQGNNYAYKATKLLGQVALSFNVDELSITASPDNIASIKTIEKLGAKFIRIQKVPRKSKLHKNSKKVAIYNWQLESERIK